MAVAPSAPVAVAYRWREMSVAGSGGGWRVFICHTSELRDYPVLTA